MAFDLVPFLAFFLAAGSGYQSFKFLVANETGCFRSGSAELHFGLFDDLVHTTVSRKPGCRLLRDGFIFEILRKSFGSGWLPLREYMNDSRPQKPLLVV